MGAGISDEGGAVFNKIKGKELFVNLIQFQQMVYLILPLNRKRLNSNSVSKLW